MGYGYDLKNRLSCDSCGACGNTRKIPCPFGYCPAPALCPECKTKYADTLKKEWHRKRKCDLGMLRHDLSNQEALCLLHTGHYLRCAALSHGDKVKVIFRGLSDEKAVFMAPETYDAFPLLKNVTLEDYAKIGTVTDAVDRNIYANA